MVALCTLRLEEAIAVRPEQRKKAGRVPLASPIG